MLPERIAMFTKNIPVLAIPSIGEVTFHCDSSQFSLIIDQTDIDYHTAYIFSKEYASIIASSQGFINGCGYSVEVTQVIDETKNTYVIGVQNANLISSEEGDFAQTLEQSFRDIYLRFAIRDYLSAIVSELDCPFLCYRAIETIKSRFENEFPKNGWLKMHELIGSNAETIKEKIKPYSDPIRHGAYSDATPTDFNKRTEILLTTKSIIELYRKFLATK